MKQKPASSETLTKQDLIDALKEFKFDMDLKFDEMELRIEDRDRERHSEILSRFDSWAGELDTAREDREITTKQLNDHEKRIKKLERVQN